MLTETLILTLILFGLIHAIRKLVYHTAKMLRMTREEAKELKTGK